MYVYKYHASMNNIYMCDCLSIVNCIHLYAHKRDLYINI